MSDAVTPVTLAIPQADLDDLRQRLALTRWPSPETVPGWIQGVPLDAMKGLVAYWQDGYDWRRCEAMLNGLGQYRTTIDGLGIHFLHVRSPDPDALPLVLTHGWPGSIIEFHKVIGPLADPAAHGGDPADAFHLVVPCLPGFGFSDKPAEAGWGVERIAAAWGVLMKRLGYGRWVAQGGDWGAGVAAQLGAQRPEGLVGIHMNMLTIVPRDPGPDPDADERRALKEFKHYTGVEAGYARIQMTRPQTIAYSLADSPVGQAAWIYEKLREWSDCGGVPENAFTRDEMLDNIMLYWLTDSGPSSARIYYESMRAMRPFPIDLPVGYSCFPGEMIKPPRKWAEPLYSDIIHWREMPRGGHFAAFEQPDLFVTEVRDCFRQLRD